MANGLKLAALCCATLLSNNAAGADINDPTQPPPGYSAHDLSGTALPEPKAAALIVTSLYLMGNKPYAMVDGQLVRPGDPLASGKVAKIDAHGVWIAVAGQSKGRSNLQLLKLLPQVAKTPRKVGMEKK
jgi:hypothetical protein